MDFQAHTTQRSPSPQATQDYASAKYVAASQKVCLSPRSMLIIIGTFLLAMLAMLPVWNAIELLRDPTYSYFSTDWLPFGIIFVCCTVPLLYAITVATFFSVTRSQVQTEQTIMNMGGIFVTIMGAFFVLISSPMARQGMEASLELFHNCGAGSQTRPLAEAYDQLSALRLGEKCATKISVEDCNGFNPNQYAVVLKDMEVSYHCSGFCYTSDTNGRGKAKGKNDDDTATAALLQQADVDSSAKKALDAAASERRSRYLTSEQDPVGTYPPTLFSQANYQSSCDGMAARDMKTFVKGTADQTFYMGVLLVLVAVLISLMKLVGFCYEGGKADDFFSRRSTLLLDQGDQSQTYGAAIVHGSSHGLTAPRSRVQQNATAIIL